MGRSGRWGAPIVVFVAVLVTSLVTLAPAHAQAVQPPPAADPWLVEGPTFEPLDGSALGVEGVGDYRGSIRLNRTGGGLAVVNHLPLDDYLRGITEVPSNWPNEAQKAQAIAARTYALYEVGRTNVNASYKAAGADICATDSCQVYTGLAKERRRGSEAWIAAVEQTKGQVITYKGAPIVAKYSSSNGGHTVAGGQPYLRAVPDPDDAYSPLHRWRVSYPITQVVQAAGLAAEPSHLTRRGDDIVATYLDPEGNPVEERLPVTEFRSRLNNGIPTPAGVPLPVPSVRYDAAAVDGSVVLDGRGWGHGIGLSQYGALGKAVRGMKAPDILAAYYAGLRPTPLPADRMSPPVRVAVALDRAEATVHNTSGRFRIVDAAGTVIAHSATGRWAALPGPQGKVRLVPPTDQAVPAGATLTAVEPPAPQPGDDVETRIALDGPAALTRITLTTPDGQTRELDGAKLRLPGPLTVRLGGATTVAAGEYLLGFERDAGAGRVATTTIVVGIHPPDPATEAAAPPDASDDPDRPARAAAALAPTSLPSGPLKGLATILFLAVATAGALWVGRRPGIELH